MNEKELVVLKTAGLLYRTKSIWQYDIGHTLRFDGFDLPDTFQVHFARSLEGESKTQIGQDSVCEVPAEYTQNNGTIYAWVYVADEETGLTKHAVEIPVKSRGAITDQEPAPEERSIIDQAIIALNAGVAAAEEAAERAENVVLDNTATVIETKSYLSI